MWRLRTVLFKVLDWHFNLSWFYHFIVFLILQNWTSCETFFLESRQGNKCCIFCILADLPLPCWCLREWFNTRLVRLPHVQDELWDWGRLWILGWPDSGSGANGSVCSCCHARLRPPGENQCLSGSYQRTAGKSGKGAATSGAELD